MDQIILRIFKMLCSYYVTSKKFKLYGIKCYYKDVRHAKNKIKLKKFPKLKFHSKMPTVIFCMPAHKIYKWRAAEQASNLGEKTS